MEQAETPKSSKRRTATTAERIAIWELLKETLNEPNSEGYIAYKDGWSDERIRDKVGVKSAASVAGVRKEMFGALKPPTGTVGEVKSHLDHVATRVDKLEVTTTSLFDRLDAYGKEMLNLNERLNRLETNYNAQRFVKDKNQKEVTSR